MMRRTVFLVVSVVLGLCVLSTAYAQVPGFIHYQGRLTDSSGQPVNGTREMQFRIYDAETGGALRWQSGSMSVQVEDGLFHVLLGSVPASAFEGQNVKWLEVTVGGQVLLPRSPIATVAHAFRAGDADTVDGKHASEFLGKTAKAADSDKLDGLDSTEIVKSLGESGDPTVLHGDVKLAEGNNITITRSGQALTIAANGTVDVGNADTVDGYHAAGTPEAEKLLALDTSAKFPNSVLYTGSGNGLDADMLDGKEASEFLGKTEKAADSDKLDGLDSSEFLSTASDYGRSGIASTLYEDTTALSDKYLGKTAKATDSDLLDGLDSSEFLSTASDYGRSGVASTLYEGTTPLSDKYLGKTAKATDSDLLDGLDSTSFIAKGEMAEGASSDYIIGAKNLGSGAALYGLGAEEETYGVFGYAWGNSGIGVYGRSIQFYGVTGDGKQVGVFGRSPVTQQGQPSKSTGVGVFGVGSEIGGEFIGLKGVHGVSTSTDGNGVWGEATGYNGWGVHGHSQKSCGGLFSTSAPNSCALAALGDSDDATGLYVQGCCLVTGDLTVWGTKSAVVNTGSYGRRAVYCQESPEVWLEDFGQGRLQDGRATIQLGPIFLQAATISGANPMKVFITLTEDCAGVYVRKGIDSFTVIEIQGGRSNVTFDYRVVARRKGFEGTRFGAVPSKPSISH